MAQTSSEMATIHAQAIHSHLFTHYMHSLRRCTSIGTLYSDLYFVYDRRQQRNPQTLAEQTGHWTHLILAYARHARLYTLRIDDLERRSDEWAPVLTNPELGRESIPLEMFGATLCRTNCSCSILVARI